MTPSRGCVLIVDDDHANIVLLRRLMERAGFADVLTTRDPFEAVKLFDARHPDLLLLDLHMPGLDGFEVLERIRPAGDVALPLPVVLITGALNDDVAEQARRAGVDGILAKPFIVRDVLDTVDAVVRRWETRPPQDP